MLGVLKRRLKPKRATNEKENQNNRKYVHSKAEPIVPVDVARIAPSQRQIHPLFEEKVQLLAYDDEKTSPKKSGPTPSLKRSPEDLMPSPLLQMPKKQPPRPPVRHPSATLFHSSASKTPHSATYHPAPNICVERGRIEFIKSPSEGSNLSSIHPQNKGCFDKRTKQGTLSGLETDPKTRQQFCDVVSEPANESANARTKETPTEAKDLEFPEEKCDVAKEFLESRIQELQKLLEVEQKSAQKERLTITRLQRQLARRDATQRDVDRERRLRTDTESRLRDTVTESERYRATLASLQREFSKMEDSVRTMLQYKSRCELLNQEKVFLTAAYESRIHQYQNTVTKLGQENESLKQQVRLLEEATGTEELPEALLDRLRSLETENASLSRDVDFQRKQYERCLDDIANQVVRALLSQKGLREEIGHLQRRIKELENQNQALANILVNKLEGDGPVTAFALPSADGKCQNGIAEDGDGNSSWLSGTFNASLSMNNTATATTSTTGTTTKDSSPASCPSPGFNVKNEEKQRLRRLYLSDNGDLSDRNLIKSLNSADSLVVVPLQRPKSLNLQVQASPKTLSAVSSSNTNTGRRCQHKKNKLNSAVLSNKKPAEDEGNESPESGNRDEGYSTMSSDVQGPGETSDLSKRELEDLKEASDETDVILADTNGDLTSIVVVEDASDPDMFFIPLNLSLSINPRHSYPLYKDFLPFQQAMRSLSDSHLCLKFTAANSPLPSPFSPSVLFVDIVDKSHPLRRTKATSSLLTKKEENGEFEDTQSAAGSWCSGVVEGCWWDAEYVHRWLKFDDNRLKTKQQQRREMLQVEYDRTEIEEWTMSCDDVTKSADQGTGATLPSIQETDFSRVDENTSEWNSVNLTIDTKREGEDSNWSYEVSDDKFAWQETSPAGSWSSRNTDRSDESRHSLNDNYFNNCAGDVNDSKRSSEAGDDAEASSAVGTDFTRDFYRLVKFESTKSLASNSSKSNGKCDLSSFNPKQSDYAEDRQMALQSVFSFIVEQQKYCHSREEQDGDFESYSRPHSTELENDNPINSYSSSNDAEYLKDVAIKKSVKEVNENVDLYPVESSLKLNKTAVESIVPHSSGIPRKKVEITINLSTGNQSSEPATPSTAEKVIGRKAKSDNVKNYQKYERETSSTKLPVRNYKSRATVKITNSKCEKIPRIENFQKSLESRKPKSYSDQKSKSPAEVKTSTCICEETMCGTRTQYSVASATTSESEGARNSLKSPNTSKSSSNKFRETKIPVPVTDKPEVTTQGTYSRLPRPKTNPRVRGTKIPIIATRKSESALVCREKQTEPGPMTRSAEMRSTAGEKRKSQIPEIQTPRHLFADNESFHEKASTKDVIDELNRMIRKGEDVSPHNGDGDLRPLDVSCCCPTGWVHVERDIDFTDPKARANLLDVMLASSGSSDSSDSSSESGGDEPVDYTHLHRLHRFRRQRKASATRQQLGVLRYSLSSTARPSIIGRENFFVRYGDKEKEAVATFDFLEDISTTSISGCSSCDSLGSNHSSCLKSALNSPTDQELPYSEIDLETPCTPTPTTPETPSDDSDERTGGPVSLSDSCADSFSESGASTEEPFCVTSLQSEPPNK